MLNNYFINRKTRELALSASPDVSVLTAVYNGEQFLADALESVQTQKGVTIQHVIVDDASNDMTPAILAAWAAKNPGTEIITLKKNIGPTAAANIGLQKCTGKYIARLDADDICLPDRLEKQFAFLETNPDVSFVGSGAHRIGPDGKIIGKWHRPPTTHEEFVARLVKFEGTCAHSSFFLTREAMEAVGGYNENQVRSLEFDLMLRLYDQGYRFANIPDPLIGLRLHPSNLSYGPTALLQVECGICALVEHILRKAGKPQPDRDVVEKVVREEMKNTGCDRIMLSRRELVNAYMYLHSFGIIPAISHLFRAIRFEPLIMFKANRPAILTATAHTAAKKLI